MQKQDRLPERKGRDVTVYNTVGTCEVTFKSKARTWGELKKDFEKNNVKHEAMKVAVGENQEELVKDEQELLEADLNIFITPIRVRSGD